MKKVGWAQFFGAIILVLLLLYCVKQDTLTRNVQKTNKIEQFKIENVEIIDTIYQAEVNLSMFKDSNEIVVLKQQYNEMAKHLPAIRNKEYNAQRMDSFFKMYTRVEKELYLNQSKLNRYSNLNISDIDTTICGYVIQLDINGRPNLSVIDTNYKLLGPAFLFFERGHYNYELNN